MRKCLIGIAVLAAAAVGLPGTAVRAMAQPPTGDAVSCELHFWPSTAAVTSNYSGVGGLAGALLAGPRPQSQGALISDLPPEAQAEALRQIDLAGLLRMPNLRLIPEQAGSAVRPNRRGPRLTGSTAPCYAELIVDYVGYSSHITAGRKFGARYWLRRYLDGSGVAEVQNGGKDVRLRAYPARAPEGHPAGLVELRNAFGQTTEGFLRNKIR
jgi:hypothetical protein